MLFAESLIVAGAKLNEQDQDQFTALICAAKEGHVEICKSLTKAGAALDM